MRNSLLYIFLIILFARCAQITPLTGGKKDVSPPKILEYFPNNHTVNFNSKSIEIQFDEYITIKDIANQLIITPRLKELPDIQIQGKKLKIKFNDILLPNTTYKLAFGNSICDLNEANVLQNLEYVFSTGSIIDSLKICGKVINSTDNKPLNQVLVALYDKDANDSVIYKEKPLYITKTNFDGSFNFSFLPNSEFKIVAFKDQNKNLIYDGFIEEIGFRKKHVTASDTTIINLNLFKELPAKNFIKKNYSTEYGIAHIIFNKGQEDVTKVNANGLLHYKFNNRKDTLSLYYENIFDTLQVFILHEKNKVDTVNVKVFSKISVNKLLNNKLLKYTLKSNLSSVLAHFDLPTFELNMPVDSINISQDKIKLYETIDTASIPVPFSVIKRAGLITTFKIKANFKQESNYVLIFKKEAISNNENRNNDSITYKFKTTSEDDFASLRLKLIFPKKENYIIRLLNDKEQIVSETYVVFPLTSSSEKNIEFDNLLPGKYFIRIIEDANNNKVFDTGNYLLNQQPEIIFANPVPIKLLHGWEIENEWIIK